MNRRARLRVVDGVPLLSVPLAEDWIAEHRLAVQDGRIVVAEFRIVPRRAVPAGGLTTRLARRGIAIGRHVDHYAAVIRKMREYRAKVQSFGIGYVDEELDQAPGVAWAAEWKRARPAATAAQPGRKPLGHAAIAAAAAAYVRARRAGHAAPVAVAARARRLSEASLRDYVHRARRLGILTPTAQGRGGGELTPLGLRLLKPSPRKTPRRRPRR